MITIDETEEILNELAAELPQAFYEKLNGGIVLLPQAKLHEQSRANDLYTLGEYYNDAGLGRYISIYYGSFARVYGRLSAGQIKEQLRRVLRHEFRHHLESLSGERDLEIEDEKYIADYIRRFGGKKP
jgi:hypothetical protein